MIPGALVDSAVGYAKGPESNPAIMAINPGENAMRTRTTLATATMLAVGALLGWLTASGRLAGWLQAQDRPAAMTAGQLDRTVLPIPEPKAVPITTLDA